MNIGELAKKTGLAPSKIRFYEKIGLLKTVKRKANGYRTYPPEAVAVLEMITTGQQAGFSLDELGSMLPADFSQWNHDHLLKTLKQKVADLEEIERRIASNKARLLEVLKEIEAKPENMDCATNAERVMSQFGWDILPHPSSPKENQ